MRKWIRALVLILLCGILVILCGGLALGMYYRKNFPVNTWINGVYCTGKTIEEVNEELVRQTELPEVSIVDKEGTEWFLENEKLELKPDYSATLKLYLRQNAFPLWMKNLHDPVRVELKDVRYGWNEEKLWESLQQLELVKEDAEKPEGCYIRYSDEGGYSLYDGNIGRLNVEKTFCYIKDCLSQGNIRIDLQEGGCYESFADSSGDVSQRQLWEQLKDFFDCKLVYDMGTEQIPLTPVILSGFLKKDKDSSLLTDEKGRILLDEASVEQWVEKLAESYNTCDTVREFQATRGDIVSVQYVTYGTKLDSEAEKKYLVDALQRKRNDTELHVPAYIQEGFVRGLDDIGDTYIEIDMTEQHMYYYVDGELKLTTDVVTGNTGKRMGTPEGINFVYSKQRNRVLRGEDYATPVKYWMPVKGGVGIHDANWRSEFGGEIYQKNGSHGCINTPPDVMAELYDIVEIGTPVIMFY